MIDIEADVFDLCYKAVQDAYPEAYVINEITMTPPKLPCVCVEEIGNTTRQSTIDSSSEEKYANLDYEVRVYVNNTFGKRRNAKAIMDVVDTLLIKKGFYRTNPRYMAFDDGTKYQMINNYICTVSQNKTIYGR